jgi:hypothetical protein
VKLGDRAGQAENLLALGHIQLLRGEDAEAARPLQQNRSLCKQLHDAHALAHADQAIALLAAARGDISEAEALLGDVAGRLTAMGKAPMGVTYAIGMADVYRRACRVTLAAILLRHALSLLDEHRSPAQYTRIRQELAALER